MGEASSGSCRHVHWEDWACHVGMRVGMRLYCEHERKQAPLSGSAIRQAQKKTLKTSHQGEVEKATYAEKNPHPLSHLNFRLFESDVDQCWGQVKRLRLQPLFPLHKYN